MTSTKSKISVDKSSEELPKAKFSKKTKNSKYGKKCNDDEVSEHIKAEANQSNISSNIAFFPCWMKCWIGFADRKICEKIENRVG